MSSPTIIPSLEALAEREGEELGTSDWVEIPQSMIDAFADATGDHQWIHVDRERAEKESPFGGTIAHGYLTLSLVPGLLSQLVIVEGCSRVINSGIEKLKLKAPVPAGARVRLAAALKNVKVMRGEMAHVTIAVRIEIEDESKPALQGDLIYIYFRD
ncbi:MAG: MaoC family dehydratase [Actinomycetota bacterium]|nr:MaoC family dehydratase [Actinomycetota bacterium]